MQLGGNAGRSAARAAIVRAMPRRAARSALSGWSHAQGITNIGHPGTHRQSRRANPAMVDDGSGAREQSREGRTIECHYPIRQRLAVGCEGHQDEDRPPAQRTRGPRAALVERTGVRSHGRTQREHDGWRAKVQEPGQQWWQLRAAGRVIPRESGNHGLPRPIRFPVHQPFREEGQMQSRRISVRQGVQVRGSRETDLSAKAMPGLRQPACSPFEKVTDWPPEVGTKEAADSSRPPAAGGAPADRRLRRNPREGA